MRSNVYNATVRLTADDGRPQSINVWAFRKDDAVRYLADRFGAELASIDKCERIATDTWDTCGQTLWIGDAS